MKIKTVENIVEGVLFVICALIIALVIVAIRGVFVADAAEVDGPERVGELIIPAIPTRRELPVLKPQIDNERKLQLKLDRWEKRKTEAEPVEEPADDSPVLVYLGQYRITGYDICRRCCGSTSGITASGAVASVGRTCAASKDFAFGTRLYIDGIGYRTVEDRGGAVCGNHIDVLCVDHPACYALTGWYDVYLVEED